MFWKIVVRFGVVVVLVFVSEFVVDAAYQIQKFVGCGSFGVVCSALDAAGQAHTCTQRDTSLRTRRMRAALLLV